MDIVIKPFEFLPNHFHFGADVDGDHDSLQRKTAKNGQFYFTLVATNGEVIGTSEMYTTEQARDGGIDAVKRVASGAETVDKL